MEGDSSSRDGGVKGSKEVEVSGEEEQGGRRKVSELEVRVCVCETGGDS